MKNRRCKILRLSEDIVLHGILGHGPGVAPPYTADGLPEGWSVERVGYDFHSASFEVLVSHPSFAEVPEGNLFPALNSVVTHRAVPGQPTVVPDTITLREFL